MMMKTVDDSIPNCIAAGRVAASKPDCPPSKRSRLPLQDAGTAHPLAPVCQIEAEVIELFQRHAAALSRYAARIARDKTLVEDGIQEALLRYFIARTEGQQIDNPRAWLFRVLQNYILDCNRKSNLRQAANLEAAAQVADAGQNVEVGYQQDETFRDALASLSPREQACILLRLEGFAYDEMAHILGIRPGTVGALLARGTMKIRKTILSSGRQQCSKRYSKE
jgi:RNA polymerase sigma-70 factor, ECF subfamily